MQKFDVLFVLVALVTILDSTTIRLCNAKPTPGLFSDESSEEQDVNVSEPASKDVTTGGTPVADNSTKHDANDAAEEVSDLDFDSELADSSQVHNPAASGSEQPIPAASDKAPPADTGTKHDNVDAAQEEAGDFDLDFDSDMVDDDQVQNPAASGPEQQTDAFNLDADDAEDDSSGEYESEEQDKVANLKEHTAAANVSDSSSSSSDSSSSDSSFSGSATELRKDEGTLIAEKVDERIRGMLTSTNEDEMAIILPNGPSFSTKFLSQDFVNKINRFKENVDTEVNTLDSQLKVIEDAVNEAIIITDARLTQMKQTFDKKVAELGNHVRALDQALNENAVILDGYNNSLDEIIKNFDTLIIKGENSPAEPPSPAAEATPADNNDVVLNEQGTTEAKNTKSLETVPSTSDSDTQTDGASDLANATPNQTQRKTSAKRSKSKSKGAKERKVVPVPVVSKFVDTN